MSDAEPTNVELLKMCAAELATIAGDPLVFDGARANIHIVRANLLLIASRLSDSVTVEGVMKLARKKYGDKQFDLSYVSPIPSWGWPGDAWELTVSELGLHGECVEAIHAPSLPELAAELKE